LVDRELIDFILERAAEDGRDSLLEYEGYELINLVGAGRAPKYFLVHPEYEIAPDDIAHIKSEQVVLKIQSPLIPHKTEAGGVLIRPNDIDIIRTSVREMLEHAPDRYAQWLSGGYVELPPNLKGLAPDAMTYKIRESIRGVLVAECIVSDSKRFGTEILVGLQWTREFGPVMTAGLGGIDAEMFAEKVKGKAAVVTASPLLTDAGGFLELFKNTTAYESISGLIRGREKIIEDDELREFFDAFISLARTYITAHGGTCIKELEINPYVISKGRLVPLDMFCTFGPALKPPGTRPVHKIGNLLKPETVGVIGVSGKGMNIGRIILNNLLRAGMKPEKLAVIKPNQDEIDGVKCYPSLTDLPFKLDMLVLAVAAEQVPGLVKGILRSNITESVILIPGGMGEKEGSEDLAAEVERMIEEAHMTEDGGPVFVGGNTLGILSVPGGYDTMFIPERKLPKPEQSTPVAFVSQSGAFMITRMSNQAIKPVYAISYGNQTDLTVSDYIHYLKDEADVLVLAVYVEGFKDLDGLQFAKEMRDAIAKGKDVVFYKAGRTREGRTATSGHTASIAGDYKVCEAVAEQAGALIANDFDEFEDLVDLALRFHNSPINGNRVFATSNAGYESVGMADNIVGPNHMLLMAKFKRKTRKRIEEILKAGKLTGLVDVKNPMDLNPMASDEVHIQVLEALMDDDNGDAIVISAIPMTGMMQTLPPGVSEHDSFDHEGSIPNRLKAIGALPKPVVAVVDSGKIYDPFVESIRDLGIPTFRSADRAMAVLGRYIAYRLNKMDNSDPGK